MSANSHRQPSQILLGFDFYGAGNIGDDLMMAGLIDALFMNQDSAGCPSYSISAHNIQSQRLRFPQISWIAHRRAAPLTFPSDNLWIGAGGTPFQLTCGTWLLRRLLKDLACIRKFKRKVLINVGAESEISPKTAKYSHCANSFDAISTRDKQSTNILTQMLDVSPDRVFTGGDLANISLPNILSSKAISKIACLGMIIAGDTLSRADINVIGDFIANRDIPVHLIAQETRNAHFCERHVYKRLSRWLRPRFSKNITLSIPDYNCGSLYDLIKPIAQCETVISTRYHGLLTAAWAGCRVAAIARSSKVAALAENLSVPYCNLPITMEKLEAIHASATIVPDNILLDLRLQAQSGVDYCL
jgi:polysaccharide pyruvyl transferase WcaK-like protein